MRAFAVTVVMLFKHYFRDRSSLFWGMVFPLLLMGLIGLAFGRGENISFAVGLVDEGGGPVSQGLRRGLAQVSVFRLTDEENQPAALDALRRGRRTLVVVIPRLGSGEAPFAAGSETCQSAVEVCVRQPPPAVLRRMVVESEPPRPWGAKGARIHGRIYAARQIVFGVLGGSIQLLLGWRMVGRWARSRP